MTIREMIQIIDRLVFSGTGKHLSDVQEAVVKGAWQGQTYQAIAYECKHSESRVRDVGYKLWQILSEQLGEDINKSNFYATFERLGIRLSQFNVCPRQSHQDYSLFSCTHQGINDGQKTRAFLQETYYNLKQAPKINHCYGREKELLTLVQWLERFNTRVVSVLGSAGIGKTTLVRHWLNTNTLNFDLVIWKNLKLYPSLSSIINDILAKIKYINNGKIANNAQSLFLELLNQNRCLIIIDNLEEIFIEQQFAGQCKPECKEIFQQIIMGVEHQSCFLLISKEKSQEMMPLDNISHGNYYLELSEIDHSAMQIFRNEDLEDEESWLDLIYLYEGNPSYLQSISILIRDFFEGKVSDFLRERPLILTEDIKAILAELYNRLSPIEKQVIWELSYYVQARSRKDLEQSLSLSPPELINGLQSLSRRYLIKTISEPSKSFSLSPVLREYVRNYT